MKIAAVSDDGVTISQHFGRASLYVVVTVENGRIVSREQRAKLGHNHFSGEAHAKPSLGSGERGHGFDAASQDRHARMITAIADCQAVLVRGMGAGAYDSLQRAGIRPVVTDVADIDQAVLAFVEGRLVDYKERLH